MPLLPALPFQAEDLIELDRFRGRALISYDMGLGKTFMGLTWAERKNAYPMLVICPAAVKLNWVVESKQFQGISPSVCNGQKPPEIGFDMEHMPKIVIINMDILSYWKQWLLRVPWKLIVVDEGQNFRNPGSKRTEALRIVCRPVPHILILSGTPIEKSAADLFPVLNILWPREFPSYMPFAKTYAYQRVQNGQLQVGGGRNLIQLHTRVKTLGMVRRKKSEVLKDLPDKDWVTIPCELLDYKEYERATTDFVGWLKDNGKERSIKNAALTRANHLLMLIAKLKLKSVVTWVNQFMEQTDEKLVLFATHLAAIDVLERRINCKKVKVDGSVTGDARQGAIQQFRTDPETRLFIGSRAAGTGINGLQDACCNVGVIEFPWTPAALTQWVDRTHRIGQTRKVTANMFVAVGTVEEDLIKLLLSRQKIAATVLDGQMLQEDIDIFSDFLALLQAKKKKEKNGIPTIQF